MFFYEVVSTIKRKQMYAEILFAMHEYICCVLSGTFKGRMGELLTL